MKQEGWQRKNKQKKGIDFEPENKISKHYRVCWWIVLRTNFNLSRDTDLRFGSTLKLPSALARLVGSPKAKVPRRLIRTMMYGPVNLVSVFARIPSFLSITRSRGWRGFLTRRRLASNFLFRRRLDAKRSAAIAGMILFSSVVTSSIRCWSLFSSLNS